MKASAPQTRRYRLIGVPSAAGSLFTGPERAAAAFRESPLHARLDQAGVPWADGGDLLIPSYLPRHDVPPVRNWPSPRVVWEIVAPAVRSAYQDNEIPLLVGGDCSVVVGSVSGLVSIDEPLHVICIDGHVDGVAPDTYRCVGAAGMGLWFATQRSHLWDASLEPSDVTVIGCTDRQGVTSPFAVFDALEVAGDPVRATQAALDGVPQEARILVHFDVDVLSASIMPAAYSPNEQGLPLEAVAAVLGLVLRDTRVAAIEVTEYVPHKDEGDRCLTRIVNLLADALTIKR